MPIKKKSSTGLLGTFSIVMITVGSVDSIRNLPATALFGSHLIFFFIMAAIFFFLPSALIASELSCYDLSGRGGVYTWVKEALGIRMGFLAIWFQWSENVIWYPTILSFVAGTIGYLFSPGLVANKGFVIAVILISFWGTTCLNLLGIKTSAMFANICSIFGLLLPMLAIIGLGIYWLMTGHASAISFHWHALLPSLHMQAMWIALTAVMMSFAGIEIATVHSQDVKTPERTFPRAMLIASIILLVTLVLGSLSIAVTVPAKNISLVAGIMQSFHQFFLQFHWHWALPAIAIMLVIGGLGGVNNWIIAPTRGMFYAAQDNNLPKIFCKQNKFAAPSALLLFQGGLVTIVSLVFLLLPTVNASYWLLTALAAQQYLIMYVLMFVAGIRMRYKYPDHQGFRIPGGSLGIWLVGLLGIIGSIIVFAVGFIPPTDTNIGSRDHYELILCLGLVIISVLPFVLHYFCQRKSDSV